MTRPIRVAIVRPTKTVTERWIFVALVVGFTFLNAWLLMLIVGAVTPWHLGYWHALLALIGLRLVQTGSGWLQWTWPGKKGETS